ncbi:MAG: hypothetical protein GF334_11355 [Candidatus Altiarchaeales archaeon]|nr:hypothetical protein [Candidatus Altiarchaeales archaeon]
MISEQKIFLAILIVTSLTLLVIGLDFRLFPPTPDADAPKAPLLGSSCGTVSPQARDECCALRNKDTPHIMCVGSWKYDIETDGCEFVCRMPQ